MKKNIFRTLSLLLVFVMLLGTFAACGGDDDVTTTTEASTEDQSNQPVDGDVDETTLPGEDGSTLASGETTTLAPGATTAPVGNDSTTKKPADGNNAATPKTAAEALSIYTKVINEAKAAKVAYKKQEYQSIPTDAANRTIRKGSLAVNTIMGVAKGSFKEKKDAKIEDNQKGTEMKWFPIPKNEKGNYLTDVNFIKSWKATALSNGNIKLVITLKDEKDSQPTPDNSGKPVSKIGAMFYPLSTKDITDALSDPTVSKIITMNSFTINYHDCTATMEYNPKNNQLVKLDHEIVAGLSATGKAAGIGFDFFQNIYSTINIWDVKY